MLAAVAVVLAVALAGCDAPETSKAFDGHGAWQWVHDVVTYDDGSPRYRVPGTPGHADGADWLQLAMAMPGWNVTRQTFTGADYEQLDLAAVQTYRGTTYCKEPDRSEVANITFHNLYATHGPADPVVWLGAHWDSKEEASEDPDAPAAPVLGANDGASGVGVLLQLMWQMGVGDLTVPFGVGVVFFDGEDGFQDCHPLAGSLYFAQTMPAGLVDRFILLDMVGDADARFIRESQSVASDPELVDLLWQHGARYAPAAFTEIRRPISDDHVPFIHAGVRAVDIIDGGRSGTFPPYWHTTDDTMDNIDAGMLGAVGDVVWQTLVDEAFLATLEGP